MGIELAPHFLTFSVPILKTQDHPGPLWRLLDNFAFYSAIVGEVITAPSGFLSDGCSVPELALSIVGYVANEPGYIHDWLYTCKKYPRATADAILREMLLARGYSHATAEEFYLGVRIGGGSHWEPKGPATQDHAEVLAALSAIPPHPDSA